eukprot:gene8698-1087_t
MNGCIVQGFKVSSNHKPRTLTVSQDDHSFDEDISDAERRIWTHALKRAACIRSLNLSSKKIGTIPQYLSDCGMLESLNLNNNKINQLPSHFQKLQRLQVLRIGNNNLQELPSFLLQQSSLHTLQAFQNSIEIVFPLPSPELLTSRLRVLNLNDNNLTALPPNIGLIKTLETLSVDNNLLTELPPEISNLSNLQVLSAKGNSIIKLPDCLCDMTSLESANFIDNCIEYIPVNITLCKRLQYLDLSLNHIQAFDWRLLKRTSLKRLIVERNPLQVKNYAKIDKSVNTMSLQELTIRNFLAMLWRKMLPAVPEADSDQIQSSQDKNTRARFRAAFVERINELPLNQACKDVLLSADVCPVCYGWFYSMFRIVIQFVPVPKCIRVDGEVDVIPVHMQVCGNKCFQQAQDNDNSNFFP